MGAVDWPQIILTLVLGIIGPGGVVATLFLGYTNALKKRGDDCCTKLADRDKADADELAARRRRDEELLRTLQAARAPGTGP